MVIAVGQFGSRIAKYAGLRMTADEYLALPEDGFRYELIDGVVVMTPSASPEHQGVRVQIELQLGKYLEQAEVGYVLSEVDVRISSKIVYRPDLVFVPADRREATFDRREVEPTLVLEVLSPSTAVFDLQTKMHDYAKFGIEEYWVANPEDGLVRFFRLSRGRYSEVFAKRDRFPSKSVKGFVLDLKAIRRAIDRQRGR